MLFSEGIKGYVASLFDFAVKSYCVEYPEWISDHWLFRRMLLLRCVSDRMSVCSARVLGMSAMCAKPKDNSPGTDLNTVGIIKFLVIDYICLWMRQLNNILEVVVMQITFAYMI